MGELSVDVHVELELYLFVAQYAIDASVQSHKKTANGSKSRFEGFKCFWVFL